MRQTRTEITVKDFEKVFGKPAARYLVAGDVVLVYRQNLLLHVAPALPIPANTGPHRYVPPKRHRIT